MTVGRRYLLGLSSVAAASLLLGCVVSPAVRSGLWFATGLALLVQGPLGWRLVRALGTERLHLIWAIGIAARFALFAAAGFLIAPRLGLALAPLLLGLWGVLMGSVAVEAAAMSYRARLGAMVVVLLALAGRTASAQEHAARSNEIDIMAHLGNSHSIELPSWKAPYYTEVELPRFAPVHVGNVSVDLSPTKHSVLLTLAAVLVVLVFLYTSRVVVRAEAEGRPPRGFAAAMEAMVLYIRQEVILPNVGPHGEGYVNYLLTVFFFILTCNLLGLLPWSATPTSNIAVTGAMAAVSLGVIEISGVRSLGLKGYLGTIFFLPEGLPGWLKLPMLVIMTPIEIIGKLAKPFALAIRLFANMTAGHVVVLALIGLTFFFQSYLVGIAASIMAMLIMLLELFVAFLQAYVFTLLTSVFIGLMRAAH